MSRVLQRTRVFRNARRIALFMPNDGEMDPTVVIHDATSHGKALYLPVLAGRGKRELWFVRYRPGQAMTANRFGIPEPVPRPRDRINPRFLDVVLTPLVAFDEAGNRLGMGGGFYDRTFAFLRQRHRWHRPYLLGIAYDFQRCERLPSSPWDVPLSGVVTDAGYHAFGSRV